MTNALATLTSKEIAVDTGFTERQVDLIREQIMPGAANDELMLFVQVASMRKLDPFMKHIYAVSRRSNVNGKWVDKWTYQVSIDGLRLIAQRSGRYEGQTMPEWCGDDGIWRNVWISNDPPTAARVGVWIKDAREPLYAVAMYRTFCQKTKEGKPTKFWAEMPEHMLAKVAESQALRKAFPEEAGGLYTTEEMSRANPDYIDVDGGVRASRVTGEIIETTSEVINDPQELTPEQERAQLRKKRDQAKKELWQHVHNNLGWELNTLNAVALALTGNTLENLSDEGLTDLYRRIVTTSPEELAAVVHATQEQAAAEGPN